MYYMYIYDVFPSCESSIIANMFPNINTKTWEFCMLRKLYFQWMNLS